MVELNERGDAIDLITLKEALTRTAELEDVGGVAYLARLVDGVPRATNVEHYATIVKEKSTLRALITSAHDILAGGLRRRRRTPTRSSTAPRSASSRSPTSASAAASSRSRDLVQGSFDTLSKLQQHRGLVSGVPTGFTELDEMTAGPAAGRPGDRRGPAVDGQDQLRAEHRPARRPQPRAADDGRLLQPRDVGAAAVHPPAHRRGAHRRAPAAQRLPLGRRLRQAGEGGRHARERQDLHRRHGVDRRPRDAGQGAPPQGRARPRPADRRLHPADAGPRPLRQPAAGAGLDLALAEGAGQGAAACRSWRCRS